MCRQACSRSLGSFLPLLFLNFLVSTLTVKLKYIFIDFFFKKCFFFPSWSLIFFLILCIWCCYLRQTYSIQSSITIFLAFLKHNCSLLTFFLMLIFIFLAHGIAGDGAISYSKRCLVKIKGSLDTLKSIFT